MAGALETSIGLAAGVALAAALPQLPYACGLNTRALLTDDVVADSLVAVDGAIEVRPVVPDPAALRRTRAGAAEEAWWRNRLHQARQGQGSLGQGSPAQSPPGWGSP